MSQDPLQTSTDRDRLRVIANRDASIRECAQRAAQIAQPALAVLEQRSQQRMPYPRLIALTPLDYVKLIPTDAPIHVVGKHISPLGLDFFHHEPITQRYAVASLETGSDQWMHFLMKITWCRFLKSNWYDSGGRFLKMVDWSDPEFMNPVFQSLAKREQGRFFCLPRQK